MAYSCEGDRHDVRERISKTINRIFITQISARKIYREQVLF